ncbi:hypothetical protein [Longispora fulva]|uniref:Uncharacterized protein n=1 Tax=Longispora fulva TaxID=619741 RepID=A0A8J7GL04_9ACTN|nr:hypothetical protein [Longispora fulva]MBG6140111.1 hypothetical protein [Longispora fulva]
MTYGDRGYDDPDPGQRQPRRRRAAEPDDSYEYVPGQYGQQGGYSPEPGYPTGIGTDDFQIDSLFRTEPGHAAPDYRTEPAYSPPPGGTPFGQQTTDPYADPYASYGWEQPPPVEDPYPQPAYEPVSAPPPVLDPPPPTRRRSSKGWLGALAGVLAVLLLLGFGVGAFFLIEDEKPAAKEPAPSAPASAPADPSATASPVAGKKDINSQATDPLPLTEVELFPAATVSIDGRAYAIQKTQSLTDCKLATTGDLGPAYTKGGCTQLVRATLFTPGKTFVATIGVLNFKDATAAASAKADTKTLLGSGKGAIAGWAVGNGTDVIAASETYLSWLPVGHYLAYCVVARADGKKPDPADPAVQQVLTDTAETYLKGQLKLRAEA